MSFPKDFVTTVAPGGIWMYETYYWSVGSQIRLVATNAFFDYLGDIIVDFGARIDEMENPLALRRGEKTIIRRKPPSENTTRDS